METHIPTRAEAFDLLKAHNQDESLIKHAPATKAVMRCFVNKFGEDEEN